MAGLVGNGGQLEREPASAPATSWTAIGATATTTGTDGTAATTATGTGTAGTATTTAAAGRLADGLVHRRPGPE
jgi:hypothetical protein